MAMLDYSNYKLGRFFVIILVLCIIGLLTWPYLKAEYYTNKYSKQLDIVAICQGENPDQGVTGFKILNHSPDSRALELYCFYANADYNNYIKLEKQINWKTIYSNRLIKDGYFYYPFYYY